MHMSSMVWWRPPLKFNIIKLIGVHTVQCTVWFASSIPLLSGITVSLSKVREIGLVSGVRQDHTDRRGVRSGTGYEVRGVGMVTGMVQDESLGVLCGDDWVGGLGIEYSSTTTSPGPAGILWHSSMTLPCQGGPPTHSKSPIHFKPALH